MTLSPNSPYRLWLFGDSVMEDSSPGIAAALEATGEFKLVVDSSFGGWGLTTDPGWPIDAPRIIAQYHPQIAIATWSWDEGKAQTDPVAYAADLSAFVRTLLTPGDGVSLVVLLEFPQGGPNPVIVDPTLQQNVWQQQTTQQDAWNRVARTVAAEYPGRALYLPTENLFAPGDRYLAWLPTTQHTWLRARKIDNVHMCPYGAARLGAWITDALTRPLGLAPMTAGWESGAWTHDPRYNDPSGACPADQPPPAYHGTLIPRGPRRA